MASGPRALAAIAYVQGYSSSQGSAATGSVTFTGAQTAGDLNVLIVGWGGSTGPSSITDSKGNTYVLAVGPTGSEQSIYYAKNIAAAAAGANTVTVTFSSSVSFLDIRVAEYSGIDTSSPLDGAVGASGTAVSISSGSLTTTNANDLLVAGDYTSQTTTAAGSGYTQRLITHYSDILEDEIVTTPGSYAGTATQNATGSWIMQMAAFKAATGGGDTSPPTMPTGLGVTAISSSQINLSWTASTDNVGVTGYEIWRCQGASCSTFSLITTVAGTTYSDTGLTAATSYSYKVRAKDGAGNLSSFSTVSTTSTSAGSGDTQPPTAPSNLVIVATSSSEVDLSWQISTDNVGVANYVVERCSGSGCSNFSAFGPVTAPPYYDTTVSAAGNYSYRVRAFDAAGNHSLYSNVVSTPIPPASPDCN